MVDSSTILPCFIMPRRLLIASMCLLSLLTCLFFAQLCLARNATSGNAADKISPVTDHAAHATLAADAPSAPADGAHPTVSETDPHAAHRASMLDMPAASAMDDMANMDGMDGNATTPTPAKPATVTVPSPTDKNAPKAIVPPPNFVERLGEVVPEGIKLRDENGNLVDVRSLMDIPTIIVPVFFTCPAACNTLQSSVAATISQVELVPGKDFRVLTVSFDETDTPEMALRKKNDYLAAMNYKFPAEEWRYLTGDLDSIKEFMTAIGFPYIRLGPGNFSHPVGVVILGPGGKVTRYLYGQWFKPFDLTMALNEAAHGKVGLSVKRLVTYCFSYDPASRKYVFNLMRVAGVVILFGAGVLLFVLLMGGKKKPKK